MSAECEGQCVNLLPTPAEFARLEDSPGPTMVRFYAQCLRSQARDPYATLSDVMAHAVSELARDSQSISQSHLSAFVAYATSELARGPTSSHKDSKEQ